MVRTDTIEATYSYSYRVPPKGNTVLKNLLAVLAPDNYVYASLWGRKTVHLVGAHRIVLSSVGLHAARRWLCTGYLICRYWMTRLDH